MKSAKLKRTVNLISSTSIGLGAMLGAGIFVFPGLAGGYAGFAAIISFAIGGIIALLTAVCTAELATAMPQSGGGYFFISRSFGSFWGTLTGISQWIGLIFACAFYLVSFGEYALTLLEEFKISWNTNTKILSFLFTLLLFIINIVGTKKVGRFQNMMVISLTIMLVLLFSYGLIDYLGFEGNSTAFSDIAPEGIPSIFTTTALIFTSYLGFVQIANIGGEVKKPNKNLPRSLILSVLIAMSLYIFIMFVCITAFPQEELKKFAETATIEVARKMLGSIGAIVVLVAGLFATLSSANASMISASRGVFALSKDDVISSKASKVNKRFGTPHIALILVTVPIAIMLIKSKLEVFAEVASFLHLIIYAGICSSILKLRITDPKWYVPTFRVPAVKIVASLGAVSCLALVCFMEKTSIIISSGILILATAYYFLFLKRKEIALSNPEPPHIDSRMFDPNILIPVDVTQKKKDLPQALLKSMPVSKLLLLGFKEATEQSESKQSEEELGEEAEKKLENIIIELEDQKIEYDKKLTFSDKVPDQIENLTEEEELQFILTLKPLSNLKQIVIPIYERSQVNSKLGTVIYNLHSNKKIKIKVVLFTEGKGESSNEPQMKQAIENQLSLVGMNIHDYEVNQKEKISYQEFLTDISEEGRLVVWSEAATAQREEILNIVLERESISLPSPMIFILNEGEKN